MEINENTFRIKPVTLNDVNELQKISCLTFKTTFGPYNTEANISKYLASAYSIDKLSTEIRDLNTYFYLGYLDKMMVGYLKINVNQAQTEKMGCEFLEIEKIYVVAEYNHMGIGSKLMMQAINLAKSLNKKFIWLGVWKDNLNALSFYQKSGFYKNGEHTFTIGDDHQIDYIMKMNL